MCGIAGILSFTDSVSLSANPNSEADLRKILSHLAHRGPDSEQIWSDSHCVFGHRRLSIVDLSDAANQPFVNKAGTVALVCNGEIYNHRELRLELGAAGRSFQSNSDCEVILHAYEEYGPQFVSRLSGMFAFAIWDSNAKQLHIARDRLGQKPLFYRVSDDRIVFASEFHALHKIDHGDLNLDLIALKQYLALGYIPAPLTVFEGTFKLPPAHMLTIDADGSTQLRTYWHPNYKKRPVRTADISEQIGSLLRESVQKRLMADVPLGCFLSGGLDSAAIVASLSEIHTDLSQFKAFTIGFENPDFDESDAAVLTASHFGIPHVLKKARLGLVKDLTHYARMFGEPFADSSAIPCLLLSELARESVTVTLSGDGADELFGGYYRHSATKISSRFDKLPQGVIRSLLAPALKFAPRLIGSRGLARKVDRFFDQYFQSESPRRLVNWSRPIFDSALGALTHETHFDRVADCDPLQPLLDAMAVSGAETPLDRALHADLTVYLPGDLLAKVDRTSMHFGLEARAPFLDHEFVEFALSLPDSVKASISKRKIALKHWLKKKIPAKILKAPKMGFAVPLVDWFDGELGDQFAALCVDGHAAQAGLMNSAVMKQMLSEHRNGERRDQGLWSLLMLETWLRMADAEYPGFSASIR